jgi:catechol 2,3-dioxygenase-like lactoylglutathione lyase family enzyme
MQLIGEKAMAKLRHIAISVADLKAAATFYEKTFDMKRLSENDIAINLSDGVVNMTLLHFPTDEMAGDARGKDYVGVHHIGFITDDAKALGERIRRNGGEFKGAAPSPRGRNAEDKYTDPEGIVFDVSEHGWLGTS